MKLDRYQQQLQKQFQSNISSASGMLGSLKADYNSASSELDSVTSVSLSASENPFDPNGSVKASQASVTAISDQRRMAHDKAVAPTFQNQYQQWQMKENDLMESAMGTGKNIGTQLGSALAGQSPESMSDIKSEANRNDGGLNNDVHFE